MIHRASVSLNKLLCLKMTLAHIRCGEIVVFIDRRLDAPILPFSHNTHHNFRLKQLIVPQASGGDWGTPELHTPAVHTSTLARSLQEIYSPIAKWCEYLLVVSHAACFKTLLRYSLFNFKGGILQRDEHLVHGTPRIVPGGTPIYSWRWFLKYREDFLQVPDSLSCCTLCLMMRQHTNVYIEVKKQLYV